MRLARLCFARLATSILALAAVAMAPAPAALLPAVLAPAQESGFHVDSRFGFKLRPPKEWSKIPLKLEEQWQVAKYLSDKTYFYTDKGGGWTWEHKPELLVIAFVSEEARKRAEAKETKAENTDTKQKLILLLSNPYKDYLDYLKRTYADGGYYVSEQKEAKVEDLAVTQYQIKVEKLTSTGPKRIVCWVFHTPDVDFAVQFETLEDSWAKLEKVVMTTLKSFRSIARTEGELPGTNTGPVRVIDDLSASTPAERRIQRMAQEKKLRERAKSSAPAGWQVFETDRFMVVTHTDEKYARRMAEQCETVLAWLDQTFPFVGPEEYVRGPVLRICADMNEEMSFRKGGDGFWFSDQAIEIITAQDQMGFGTESWASDRANQGVLSLWFSERDRDMWWAMPSWLRGGLMALIANARAKGDKLEFKANDWERDKLRERGREGKSSSPRELLKMSGGDFTSGSEWWGRNYEVAALVRFFVAGAASKNPRTKDVLREYIKNLHAVVEEIKAEEKSKEGGDKDKPKTEAEEEARFKAQSQSWKAREQRVIDATYERTFRSWSDKEWKEFEDVYFKSATSSR